MRPGNGGLACSLRTTFMLLLPPWATPTTGTPSPHLGYTPCHPPRIAPVPAKLSCHKSGLLRACSSCAGPTQLPASALRQKRWCECTFWHVCDTAWLMQVSCIGQRGGLDCALKVLAQQALVDLSASHLYDVTWMSRGSTSVRLFHSYR